ncbi:MAG: 16S rRNA (guanine(966)-N(2))-methyltransferase RsmD [Bacilli bacterium]|nr:16S rRNA (guanine(966)-N(2))-methyltransferase RsmD [Bacilli bacterium]
MRIVGGKYRHRQIIYPNDIEHTRPTKDRIREAIFSAIGDITNYEALDLYAGSGAMGLEALSRGAKRCAFVDISNIAIKTIKDNISNLKINEQEYLLIKDKDINALKSFKNKCIKFDIVFLDPPYEQGDYQTIIDILIKDNLLSDNYIIVIEANREVTLENIEYSKKRDYHYGEISVFIYWR